MKDNSWLAPVLALLMLCVMFGGPAIYANLYLHPKFVEIEAELGTLTGLEIQKVTINSPTFYVELDTVEDFIEAIGEQNATIIYTNGIAHNYGLFYIIFNQDYTIGYRIHIETLLEWEEN